MYELKVSVSKVMGTCTANPPVKPGDYFTVRDGDIRIPDGGYICLYALQSLLPIIPSKERKIAEDKDADWMWRIHHVQCPDPAGRVIFKIERVGEIVGEVDKGGGRQGDKGSEGGEGSLKSLRVVVEEVRGKCTSGMRAGIVLFCAAGAWLFRLTAISVSMLCARLCHCSRPSSGRWRMAIG